MSMKKNKALLAEWSTPQDLFDKLDAEFGFTLDVCAIQRQVQEVLYT